MNKTLNLKGHNEERFGLRDEHYAEVLNAKKRYDIATITRAKRKDSIKEDLMQQKEIELSIQIEKNRLRTNDAV